MSRGGEREHNNTLSVSTLMGDKGKPHGQDKNLDRRIKSRVRWESVMGLVPQADLLIRAENCGVVVEPEMTVNDVLGAVKAKELEILEGKLQALIIEKKIIVGRQAIFTSSRGTKVKVEVCEISHHSLLLMNLANGKVGKNFYSVDSPQINWDVVG